MAAEKAQREPEGPERVPAFLTCVERFSGTPNEIVAVDNFPSGNSG